MIWTKSFRWTARAPFPLGLRWSTCQAGLDRWAFYGARRAIHLATAKPTKTIFSNRAKAPRWGWIFNANQLMLSAEPQNLPQRTLAWVGAAFAIGGPCGLAGPITRRKRCRAHCRGRDRL